MKELKLAPPWVEYAEKVKALFGQDPEINVEYDGDKRTLTLRVESGRKADALGRLMPATVLFGSVAAKVVIVPANAAGVPLDDDAPTEEVLRAAFNENPAVTQIRAVSKGLFRDLCYCVFAREVVQYPADNLADINGNRSMLMEEIAREVLAKASGVYFCTSGVKTADGKLGADYPYVGDAPLGVWP